MGPTVRLHLVLTAALPYIMNPFVCSHAPYEGTHDTEEGDCHITGHYTQLGLGTTSNDQEKKTSGGNSLKQHGGFV